MKEELIRSRLLYVKESLSSFYPSGIRMAGAGLQFLNTILIAHKLGDDGSSSFFFWCAIIMTAAPIASYGLEQIALRDVPRLQIKGVASVKSFLAAVRVISLALCLIIGGGLLVYAGITDGWAPWQLLIPFGLAAMATVMINGEVLKGLSHPVQGVLFGHFVPVSLFTLCILLFVDGKTPIGLLVIWFCCFITATLFVRLAGQPEIEGSPFVKPDSAIVKNLLKESGPIFCGNIFGALSFMLPLIILKEFRPGAEVSYVTTAFRISILIAILAGAIHSVFAPRISRAAESEDGLLLFQVYSKAIGFSLIALSPPLIVGIIFPEVVMHVFGESFRDGANTLRLLLLANLLTLILGPVLQLLIMIGGNRHLPKFGIFKLIFAVTAAWILVPKFGGVGMVIAMSSAFLLEEVVVLIYIVKKMWKPALQ